VNRAKYVIYFLFEFMPSLSMSFLIVFLISEKMKKKSNNNKIIFEIRRNCKFIFESSIKLFSIKVKKVITPTDKVMIKRNIKYIFFLIKSYILYN